MPARAEQPLTGNKLGDAEKVLEQCHELEAELAVLQVAYEQFFLGMERKPPAKEHTAFKKKLVELRSHVVRSVVAKVRVANLATRLATYERLWDRTLKEIESGTYRRDLFKARLHAKKAEKAKTLEKKDAKKNGAEKNGAEKEPEPVDEDLDVSEFDEPEAPSAPPPAPALPPVKAVLPPAAPAAPPPPGKPLITAPLTPASAKPAATVSGPRAAAASANSSGPRPAASSATSSGPRPAASSATSSGARPAASSATTSGSRPNAASSTALRPVATGANPAHVSGPRPAAAEGLSDSKIKAIYDAYVMAKRRCGEDTSKLSLQSVGDTLKKQVPELMKQHKAKSVEFKVVIKDGKAVLRALPKE